MPSKRAVVVGLAVFAAALVGGVAAAAGATNEYVQHALKLYQEFDEYQATFVGDVALGWTHSHPWFPVVAVVLYSLFIFLVPLLLRKPYNLRSVNAVWNLLLAVFSVMGARHAVPCLLQTLFEKGFIFTICADPHTWYGNGYPGFWVAMFIYSKFPELMDTVFLVLQKKKVIFLHWFHHITVLLYCWHAHHFSVGPGLWFASMNYCVHSIMYAYYFVGLIGLRKMFKPIAPIITTLQLAQMVGGVAVTVFAAHQVFTRGPGECHVEETNLYLAFAMYLSYFVLFAILFHNLYIAKDKGGKRVETGCPDVSQSCNVGDGSGHFRYSKADQDGKDDKGGKAKKQD